MSQEQLLTADSPNKSAHARRGNQAFYYGDRDATLYELLGTDYEFAHNSGLINLFYYNPDTDEDGLMHTLGGEYYLAQDGTRIPSGFHHEPSAEAAWVYDSNGNKVDKPITYVDRSHLEGADAKHCKRFREVPWNSYRGIVSIDGAKKKTYTEDPNTGKRTLVVAENSMFPKEYDALAVMQTIRQAVESRDKTKDIIDLNSGTIITSGEAIMLDGMQKTKDASRYKAMQLFPQLADQLNLKKHEGRADALLIAEWRRRQG